MKAIIKSGIKWFFIGGLIGVSLLFCQIIWDIYDSPFTLVKHLDFLGPTYFDGFEALIFFITTPLSLAIEFLIMSILVDFLFLKKSLSRNIDTQKYVIGKIFIMTIILFIFAGIPSLIDYATFAQAQTNEPLNWFLTFFLNLRIY